jgi:hypothetical protein
VGQCLAFFPDVGRHEERSLGSAAVPTAAPSRTYQLLRGSTGTTATSRDVSPTVSSGAPRVEVARHLLVAEGSQAVAAHFEVGEEAIDIGAELGEEAVLRVRRLVAERRDGAESVRSSDRQDGERGPAIGGTI